MGAHARLNGDTLQLTVEALTPNGALRFRREGEVAASAGEDAARALGVSLGLEVRQAGGNALLVPSPEREEGVES